MHFKVDYEEFNPLATSGHLFFDSPNVSCQPSLSHVPHQAPLQPHPNIHEIPAQNVNDGWNVVPSDHPNENLGWGQLINPPIENIPSHSSSESPHSRDLSHKWPTPNVNLKIASIVLPNVVSTNVVRIVKHVGHVSAHVVDRPDKHLYHDHRALEKMQTENNAKDELVVVPFEFASIRQNITDQDLFPKIAAHCLQFTYKF